MNTSGFSLLLLIIISSFRIFAQTNPVNDTLAISRPERFLRVGIDLTGIGLYLFEPPLKQLEVTLDSEIANNWFGNLEVGTTNFISDQANYNYHLQGFFFRVGVDYNLLERQQKTRHDVVVLGLRYGFSWLSHGSERFVVYDPYWGHYTGSLLNQNHHLHWIELKGGIKTEIFKNLFLGWSLRTRIPLWQTESPRLDPYFIGGFGRGTRNAPLALHYTLMYKFGF